MTPKKDSFLCEVFFFFVNIDLNVGLLVNYHMVSVVVIKCNILNSSFILYLDCKIKFVLIVTNLKFALRL